MYKIMLADDEGIVIDALKFIIEKNFGDACIVEYAKTGRNVIELAETFRPDIAFMDIQMPGINGIEAMKEIKKFNSSIMYIVLTAYDKFDYAKEAINLGVLDYLNKPIEQTKIVEILKKAMARIDAARAQRTNELIIREKLETVVPIIESGLIYEVLFQEHFKEDINNFKNLLGIKSDYGFMMAFVFGDTQEGNHMTNAVGASIKAQSSYQILREMIKDTFPGIIGPVMGNKIPLFMPTEQENFNYAERIEIIEKSRELARRMWKRVDVRFRVGIGSIHPMNEASFSYNEAVNSLINTTASVAHVNDLPIGCEYEESYPIDLEKKIFSAVERGEYSACVEATGRFYDWMLEAHGESKNDIKLKVLEFVLWAEHMAYESGGMTYHFRSRSDYLPTLYEMSGHDELRGWFVAKIGDACHNVKQKKEESSSSVVEKAKSFIKAQYHRDISLDDVSKEVDISPYYFSKLFKEEAGENFIEYLTNIRLKKAKELLDTTEMSMKEIGIQIGYSDPNYFSRIFKKNFGITPTEYKEGMKV